MFLIKVRHPFTTRVNVEIQISDMTGLVDNVVSTYSSSRKRNSVSILLHDT